MGIKTFLYIALAIHLANAGCPFSSPKEEPEEPLEAVKDVADPETTTPNGCTCTSLCGASVDDLFKDDWCFTANECGEFSVVNLGYRDYCQYLASSKPDWLALDWKVKQDLIWAEVKADSSFGGYHIEQAATESIITSFENQWDVMPAGRVKIIHGIGAVCPISIDIAADSPFTGVLKGGQTNGFIRMGGAADWTSLATPGMTPGVGLKFLRTGESSANVVMLNNLNPMPSFNHNFFAVPLRNHVSDDMGATILPLAVKFCQVGHCITKVGLSDMCKYDQEGTLYDTPNFPFKIELTPADVQFQEHTPASMEEFMAQFDAIPVGTTIYTLKAYLSPDDSEGMVLGNVVTTDNCVSSLYGDTRMFFKHQYIEDDIALKPEWTDAYFDKCFCNAP